MSRKVHGNVNLKRDTFQMLTLHSEWNFILENSYSSVNVVHWVALYYGAASIQCTPWIMTSWWQSVELEM